MGSHRISKVYLSMKVRFIFAIIFLFNVLHFGVNAQKKLSEFPEEPEKFLKELKSYMSESSTLDGKAVFKLFEEQWAANAFTDNEKSQIRLNANALLKKRARGEQMTAFVQAMIDIIRYEMDDDSRNKWQDALDYMFTKRNFSIQKIEAFFFSTSNLLSGGLIYKPNAENAARWFTHYAAYRYEFMEDEVLIQFDKLDLSCIVKDDSIHIYNTSGSVNPITNQWTGRYGRVTWEQAGLSPDSVFADLSFYTIDLKKSMYEADSVKFTNYDYAKEPLLGRLQNKVVESTDARISYPRFINYSDRITIPSIFPGVDYHGGFSMNGNRFLSKGESGEDAWITFKYKDTVFVKCYSNSFVISKNQIISNQTKAVIYLDKDSIYHPGINFRYSADKNELSLFRTGEGMSKAPFFDSYHSLEMDFEQVVWKTDEPRMEFSAILGGDGGSAVFESIDYFSNERYLGLMGYDQQHPFTGLIKYYNLYKLKEFTAAEYADFLRMPITPVRQQLMTLSYLGVIDYQVDKEIIILRDRLFKYVKAVSGVIDFDVISFESNPGKKENASLSLLNYDLKLYGIPQIQLSDSQSVMIYPTQGEIIMKKNRDFEFDGKVEAGKFEFFGKEFLFSYENFHITLDNIDSLKIWIERANSQGLPELHQVRTVIANITGDLLIDKPNNKSGRVSFPEYPIFNSKRTSYVYYDKPAIQHGVYRKEDFYFMIDPYSIDSLDVFSTNSLRFDGEFYSANIFPPFRESLKVQADLSLGFITQTPETGFPTYVNKGRYFNTIHLSNRGLRGNGELKYVTSTSQCDDFIFFPDSMNAFPQQFSIAKQMGKPQFPNAKATNAYQHWEPYENQLYVQNGITPFEMYENAMMTGTLRLRPEILEGQGNMKFEEAEMNSKDFSYYADAFEAQHSSFDLKSEEPDLYSFRVENVKGKVDFVKRQGTFELNNDSAFIDLPPIQYMVSMDMFNWYMDVDEIDMMVSTYKNLSTTINPQLDANALADANDEGALFLSVHPAQDSLAFFGLIANYKLKEFLLTGQGVKSIPVADARILPGDGMVFIERAAKMRTLENARILADQVNRFHLMFNAIVTIEARNKYVAMADYHYKDENNRNELIHFDLVGVDDSLRTFARGVIAEEANFTLSPYFNYKGNVQLLAPREFLTFHGGAQLIHTCSRIPRNYFGFKSEINPQDVVIPVGEELVDFEKNTITAGIYMTKDSTHIYTSFLNKPEGKGDICNLDAKGVLIFDKQSREYQIGPKEKIENPDLPGNMLKFSVDKCMVEGEGKIDLGIYAGQVKFNTAGKIYHDLNVDSVEMEVMMVMDFYLPSEVNQVMTNTYLASADMEPADLSDEVYTRALYELLDEKTASEAMKNLSLYGSYKKVPDVLEKEIVLTNVRLRWNSSEKTYESISDLSIGNMGKVELNRLVFGKLEMLKTRASNEFTLYLEAGSSAWYFFEYKRNNLFVISSDDTFNFTLKDLKPERRRNEVDREPPLTVIPANERKKKLFLEKYQINEMDEEEDSEQ